MSQKEGNIDEGIGNDRIKDGRYIKSELHCERCGEKLSSEDGDNPVEKYTGTYNGLCERCTHEEPYIVKEYFDGARKISYPPISPSNSRKRREFISYEDCEECGGKGMVIVSESNRKKCEKCHEKYSEHPLRQAKREMKEEFIPTTDDWENEIEEGKVSIETGDELRCLAKKIFRKRDEDRNAIREVINRRFEEAKEMRIDEGIAHIKDCVGEIKNIDLNKNYW